LEYQIDLSSHFNLYDTININESCEFTLQGSGLEDNEVKVAISLGAALKINKHSKVLTIKEIRIPSTDHKNEGLMTSVLSFEPSGVVFSDDSVNGEFSSGDYITVTTPTLMTWDANWNLSAAYISNALDVVSKENVGDDKWQPCQYGDGFNGVLDISEKKGGTRIIAKYALKHFSFFSIIRKLTGLKLQAYAICAMSKDQIDSPTYSIQCCICDEHPNSRPILSLSRYPANDYCFIAYQDIFYYGDWNEVLPAIFKFTEYQPDDNEGFHLFPNEKDLKVEVNTIDRKFNFIEDSSRNVGNYKITLEEGSHDENLRTRIILNLNTVEQPNPLWITVRKSLVGFSILDYYICL